MEIISWHLFSVCNQIMFRLKDGRCSQVLLFERLGAGGGVEEAARARVTCAWAKFKEIRILTVRGASIIIPHHGKDIQGRCPECIDMGLKAGR